MIDPKTFYRKMDHLLTQIGQEEDSLRFLPSIRQILETTFGNDIRFENGRIYQELDGDFYLITNNDETSGAYPNEISTRKPEIELILKHGTYIFTDPGHSAIFSDSALPEKATIGFVIWRGNLRKWIFVFDLSDDWVREEVELCMNAVRSALNARLYTMEVRDDLEQAAEIQRSLLPARAPVFEGYEIAGKSESAELVGGDLYDFIRFSDDMIGLAIGDASGHGLPAALLVRDVVTGLRMGLEEEMKMVHTITKLNRVIHRSALSTRFISLFYGELEQNGNFIYVNAGHPTALHVTKDSVIELEPTGTVIGPLSDLMLHRAYIYLAPGDMIVLFTDGLTEQWNTEGDMLDYEAFQKLLLENKDLPTRELVNLIFSTVETFSGPLPWQDDASLVIVKRNPVV